jgi:hypothetical protein
VTTFFKNRHHHELEQQLRKARSNPPETLVRVLAARVAEAPRPRARPAARLALAGALTVTMVGVFGAFGGLGYAASAVATAARSANPVRLVVGPRSTPRARPTARPPQHASTAATKPAVAPAVARIVLLESPASDQYKPGKGCGDQNHVHAREDECKKLK